MLTFGRGGANVCRRRTGASAAGMKASWRVIRHAPHEIYENIMKKIVVLFHLTALYTPDNKPTRQSWLIIESQSQQCLYH